MTTKKKYYRLVKLYQEMEMPVDISRCVQSLFPDITDCGVILFHIGALQMYPDLAKRADAQKLSNWFIKTGAGAGKQEKEKFLYDMGESVVIQTTSKEIRKIRDGLPSPDPDSPPQS